VPLQLYRTPLAPVPCTQVPLQLYRTPLARGRQTVHPLSVKKVARAFDAYDSSIAKKTPAPFAVSTLVPAAPFEGFDFPPLPPAAQSTDKLARPLTSDHAGKRPHGNSALARPKTPSLPPTGFIEGRPATVASYFAMSPDGQRKMMRRNWMAHGAPPPPTFLPVESASVRSLLKTAEATSDKSPVAHPTRRHAAAAAPGDAPGGPRAASPLH